MNDIVAEEKVFTLRVRSVCEISEIRFADSVEFPLDYIQGHEQVEVDLSSLLVVEDPNTGLFIETCGDFDFTFESFARVDGQISSAQASIISKDINCCDSQDISELGLYDLTFSVSMVDFPDVAST